MVNTYALALLSSVQDAVLNGITKECGSIGDAFGLF
jgi:hypothetical protein